MLAGHIDGGDAWVENKSCSITVHCRTREITPAVADVFADPRVLTPPARIIVGPLSVNLLLPDLPTKGDAVRKLMEDAGCARAVYIGDEETDEYVFRLRDPRILGVRVGRGEASAAPYFLESQSDIGAFIDSLIAVYEKARSERA
jgi:trehalose 6-phosphate phosphatase